MQIKGDGIYPHGHNMKRIQEQIKFVGEWTVTIENPLLNTKRVHVKKNLTPDVFLVALAVQLEQTQTFDIGGDPYIAVGDNGATPVAGNTQLGNETARRLVAVQSRTTAQNEYSVFFNQGELSGNYREIGLFMTGNTTQATSSANTGILASRIQEDFTVGSGETVTIAFRLTFTR